MQERATPVIEYAERSDPGRDPEKQVNEDACGHRETRFGHLCVVCDGMGGHAAGREAAELALATIVEGFERAEAGERPAEVLRAAIEEASRRVHVMRTSEIALGRPGSTVVAALLHAHGTEIAHVGDSRAYLVHEGQISRLTRDHSIVQELVDRGLLSAQQAAHHPEANRITRALGMTGEVEVDVRAPAVPHVTGDAFVLCSDGLSDLVEDQEILAIVASEPAAQAVGKLVDLANARGGHDNVTVIVLRAREAAIGPAGGLAPTVALTQSTEPMTPAAGGSPAGPSGRTVVERTLHALEPSRPLEPTPPPSRSGPPPRRIAPALILGLSLAGAAGVLLVAVLLEELGERSGKRNASRWPTAGLDLGGSDAMPDAPTPLEPGSVPMPAEKPPGEPVVPLDPSSVPRRRHPR